MNKTDLSKYNNSWYNPGGNSILRILWYFVNIVLFINRWCVSSGFKVRVLRWFGAKIGKNVTIKPGVNIKYPWRLTVGDNVWVGEGAWIDNLADVTIGNNACISQGAMLLCGNHNYKKETFDLMIGEIHLEDGAWVGAMAVVCPGVTLKSHSVLSVGSVASSDLDEYTICRGNPAVAIKHRVIE